MVEALILQTRNELETMLVQSTLFGCQSLAVGEVVQNSECWSDLVPRSQCFFLSPLSLSLSVSCTTPGQLQL